jgi:polyisoprenoid-binding protein YceI
VHKRAFVGALFLLLTACGAPPPRAPATSAPPAPAPPSAPNGAATGSSGGSAPGANIPNGAKYRIDPAHSELRLLVYRAGVMASLGHDHVIVNRSLTGWVSFTGDPLAASFELSVPVGGFVVDDAAVRREEGEAFAEEVSEDAKAGTLHNMLGPAVLDADGHPAISVRSVSIRASGVGYEATVALSVAGHESRLTVPFALEIGGGSLHASGATSVRQSDLGLTPFSVMLGALKVKDEIEIKFRLVATAG